MKEESPFQKWYSEYNKNIVNSKTTCKNSWNAFADVLYEWIEKDEIGINAVGIMQKIKEMKEN